MTGRSPVGEILSYKNLSLGFVFLWFAVGGVAHFIAADMVMRIVPPELPFRREAVYITGFFELAGAIGLLFPRFRRAAGLGLIALTVAVTPANIYMWLHPSSSPSIPEWLLFVRLVMQFGLISLIWSATFPLREITNSENLDFR